MEGVEITGEYISVGVNRVPHCLSWGEDDYVAYGAHNSVAIYDFKEQKNIYTLPGHSGRVNCVEWVRDSSGKEAISVKDRFFIFLQIYCSNNAYIYRYTYVYTLVRLGLCVLSITYWRNAHLLIFIPAG